MLVIARSVNTAARLRTQRTMPLKQGGNFYMKVVQNYLKIVKMIDIIRFSAPFCNTNGWISDCRLWILSSVARARPVRNHFLLLILRYTGRTLHRYHARSCSSFRLSGG